MAVPIDTSTEDATTTDADTGATSDTDASGDAPDGGDADGGITPPATAEEAMKKLLRTQAEYFCSAAFKCPSKLGFEQRRAASRFGSNPRECVDGYLKRVVYRGQDFSAFFRPIREDLNASLAKFNPQQAVACLEIIRRRMNNSCKGVLNSGFQRPVPCRKMIQGRQKLNEPCASHRHCETLVCDEAANSSQCYGSCAGEPSYVGEGAKCDYSSLLCDLDGASTACTRDPMGTENTCAKIRSLVSGNPCGNSLSCERDLTCTDDQCQPLDSRSRSKPCELRDPTRTRCQIGLVCRASITGMGSYEQVKPSCAPPLGKGDSCYRDAECAVGLYCKGALLAPDQSMNSRKGNCTPKKNPGQNCSSDNSCWIGCDNNQCTKPTFERNPGCRLP